MIKKILKIVLVIVILLAIGLGAYWLFDRGQGGSGLPFSGDISIGDLFPFGSGGSDNGDNTPITNPNPDDTNPNPNIPVAPPRLWQISVDPQSGVVAFNASSSATRIPTVRFVDKATGNVFESSLTLLGQRRVSNTTIPKVYEALWQPSGNSLVVRYLDENNETIKSAYGKIGAATTAATAGDSADQFQELQTTFLSNDITSLSINKSNSNLAFVIKNLSGSQIFVADQTGSNPKKVFESSIKDLAISWVSNTTLGLLTKPSADAVGQFYFLKTDTGSLSRVMGGKNGLSALANPGGTKVFFSESRNNSFSSGILDPKTGVETKTPFSTLSDKCVWSEKTAYLYCATPKSIPSGKYPDHWYQGKISLTDTLWRVDSSSGSTEFLFDPSTINESGIDAINLTLDPDEEYLVFTNKKDSQLWGLKIQGN